MRTRTWHFLALFFIVSLAACSRSSDTHGAGTPGASPAARVLVPAKSTYDVALKPETKVIDSGTMVRAYRGVGSDGTLTFDAAAEPGLAMTAGTIAIFAEVAMLQITKVSSTDGKISVAGVPAGLEDAIDHGHVAWSA